jgi:hypothetical protein
MRARAARQTSEACAAVDAAETTSSRATSWAACSTPTGPSTEEPTAERLTSAPHVSHVPRCEDGLADPSTSSPRCASSAQSDRTKLPPGPRHTTGQIAARTATLSRVENSFAASETALELLRSLRFMTDLLRTLAWALHAARVARLRGLRPNSFHPTPLSNLNRSKEYRRTPPNSINTPRGVSDSVRSMIVYRPPHGVSIAFAYLCG